MMVLNIKRIEVARIVCFVNSVVANEPVKDIGFSRFFMSFKALLLASIISFIGKYKWWPVGIYTAIIGVFILFVEYPRSAKKSGRTNVRKFQHYIANINMKLGVLYTNYFVRFVLYIL
jgi:hypothetical protein